MRAELILPGRPVTKKNHGVIASNGRPRLLPSKAYREYETSCLWFLKRYWGPRFGGPVHITAQYWMPDRRSWPDLVGLLQATGDILQKAGIIANDRQIVSWDGSRIAGVDELRPRTEITITEVDKP